MESATGGTGAAVEIWLSWYESMGVDACVHDVPTAFADDRQSRDLPTSGVHSGGVPTSRAHPGGAHSGRGTVAGAVVRGMREDADRQLPQAGRRSPDAVEGAREIAARCGTLAEIEDALRSFDGCALRRTANRLCFGDGNPQARIMLIGEAPGAQEDRQGKPFVGPSGQLLDRMLATIGLDRTRVWITNAIFWRPPGNRTPTAMEIAVCQPFLERQVEILDPGVIVFVGGTAARTLLGVSEGVTRLRGRRMAFPVGDGSRTIPAIVMFHPAYLLRQPVKKKDAWNDLLTISEWLDEAGARSVH